MSNNRYVLALYDIRAKQNFIFRTNHIKEIIGASAIIRDCFKDYLFPQAKRLGRGIFSGENDDRKPFSRESFEKHLEEGYIGEIVYDGGGNLILLFKDVETYRNVNYLFTKEVMEKIGTLRVLSSYIERVNFDDYKEDSRKLYAVHSVNENQESNIAPWSTLPIVQVDRRTSMPLVGKLRTENGMEKLSKESIAKIEKYYQEAKERQSEFDEKQIDNLVLNKGEDSLLAIVYIDGNNMGARVQDRIAKKHTYEECVAALREFSLEIQKNYIDERKDNLYKHLSNKANMYKWRLVLGAGDEINFICNAHDAFPLARAYLESLPAGCSSCAGIAVFHSHAPYADVYRIAEECCESGKQLMRELGIENASFIDFHYCQGAIDVSLDKIRQVENNDQNSLPWLISCQNNPESQAACEEDETLIAQKIHTTGKATIGDVENMLALLKLMGRSNVKGLATVAKDSLAALKLDLKRIEAHMSEENRDKLHQLAGKGIDINNLSEQQRRLIYDLSTSYDLWFKGGEERMRYEGELTITLKSDLCVGSGYSYAGLIDSDICFDQYGIPYIPARRLKGCLRQSAEDYLLDRIIDDVGTVLSETDIDDIFGVSGDYVTRGVCFENAYPEHYDQLFQELELVCKKAGMHQESILRSFTAIRGQTKLKDGVAEDNSLRYTRVLNHYSPLDGKEMVFISRFGIHESDEPMMKKLEAIAKATRQIGLKRNRGLGSIVCKLSYGPVSEKKVAVSDSEKEKVIRYTIRNTHPLMLSNLADTESIKYIPGQTMLGFLAGAYFRATGKSSEEASTDPDFAQLFLGGNTKYMNLVPSSDGKEYFPAPTYMNRLKTTKKYVNVINQKNLQPESYSENYDPRGGNQPKKLSGKFVSMDDALAIDVKEVDTKMVYHHSKRVKSRAGEEGILYCMEVVEPMQEFSGRIYTTEKYVPILTELLKNGRISLGKSKSAQYGACRLLSLSVEDASDEVTTDETIVVTFCSDGIFLNNNGEYTVYEDEIYDLIARDLGIEQFIDRIQKVNYPSMLSVKEVVGYQSTWNLRRMPVPAICAGSCVIYPLKEKISFTKNMVGERNHEGYGLVRVDSYHNMKYEVKMQGAETEETLSQFTQDKSNIRVGYELLQGILLDSVMDSMKEAGIQKSICDGISSSTLGRITLMLKESLCLNEDSHKAKADFYKRINSIKSDGARKEGNKIYGAITTMPKDLPLNREQRKLASLLGVSQERLQELLEPRWGEYAMTILVLNKYQKSAGKGE